MSKGYFFLLLLLLQHFHSRMDEFMNGRRCKSQEGNEGWRNGWKIKIIEVITRLPYCPFLYPSFSPKFVVVPFCTIIILIFFSFFSSF